jgi:hypothetical protein
VIVEEDFTFQRIPSRRQNRMMVSSGDGARFY